MTGIADKIMQRVSVHDSGRWVCTPKDFMDLGSREAVDQALSRLTKAGRLRRVSHGLYDMPRISNVLNRPARRPEGHPRLLFKGGTSLSKAFGLIERFSEDIDLVVFRDGLGFEGGRAPTVASGLSNKKRAALFKDLGAACRGYIRGALRTALASRIDELATDCEIVPDEGHVDGQTLFIEYPTLFPSSEVTYVAPRVKVEAGARSALDPNRECTVTPYIADELPGWSFASGGLRVIASERNYWEKSDFLDLLVGGFQHERLPR